MEQWVSDERERERDGRGVGVGKLAFKWNSLLFHLSKEAANFQRHQFTVRFKYVWQCTLSLPSTPFPPPPAILHPPPKVPLTGKFTLILARTHFAYWSAISEGCSVRTGVGPFVGCKLKFHFGVWGIQLFFTCFMVMQVDIDSWCLLL